MDATTNALNWFEIPANDIQRAKGFYEAIFEIEMESANMMGIDMAFFPGNPGSGKVSGALCKSEVHSPAKEGAVIYLNANPDLQVALGKVENAGGQILMPKTKITGDIGYMAFFIDTEGNRMALHSQR